MQNTIYRIIFILGITAIILGLYLNTNPNSKTLLLAGYITNGFIFTPLYAVSKFMRYERKSIKTVAMIGLFSIVSLTIGTLLTLLNNEYGQYISLAGLMIFASFFIPLLIYILVVNKNNRIERIIVMLTSALYVTLCLYSSSIILEQHENSHTIYIEQPHSKSESV